MQDSLLLCQLIIGGITLRGYRMGQQYWIVVWNMQPMPQHFIFNFFEEMNQVWLELKNSTESQVKVQLSTRAPGVQVSRPRKKITEPGLSRESDRPALQDRRDLNDSREPSDRPTPPRTRPTPPRPRNAQ